MPRYSSDLILDAKGLAERLEPLVPVALVAETFGVSGRTVREWVRTGRIRRVVRTSPGGSGRVLVPVGEVERLHLEWTERTSWWTESEA